MANDLVLTSSGGATLATDANASTEHFQLIKLVYGALNTDYIVVGSSKPLPVASASSGAVQISGTVVSASSGLVGITSGVITLSSNPTVVSASSGLIQLTSAIGISSGTVGLTSGTVTLSSNHTFVSASSGLIQLTSAIGISSGTVGLTSGTVTLSSNPTVVNASSGVVQTLARPAVTTSGLLMFHAMSTGGAVATNISTAPLAWYGYALFNSGAAIQAVKFYNTTGPTVGGSTANLLWTVMVPGSTGGGGANLTLPFGVYTSNGLSYVISASHGDTDTGAPGTNTVSLNVPYLV